MFLASWLGWFEPKSVPQSIKCAAAGTFVQGRAASLAYAGLKGLWKCSRSVTEELLQPNTANNPQMPFHNTGIVKAYKWPGHVLGSGALQRRAYKWLYQLEKDLRFEVTACSKSKDKTLLPGPVASQGDG